MYLYKFYEELRWLYTSKTPFTQSDSQKYRLRCFASGVCGGIGLPGLGGPCMSPIPPVPPPCAGGVGCGAGYTCGAYGCYRSRARVHGAGTLRSGPVLMGADRFSQFRRLETPVPRKEGTGPRVQYAFEIATKGDGVKAVLQKKLRTVPEIWCN
ncbi:hypothetical protein ANCCAN_22239 [Ancylostoma caninum]|uniref:Uncharacterized protein n=1 Tax=Ancylostoma caninum TaxID=29170 RepID=A0A368FME8_ANCCA|nr:hypothetical protein ANCCAN_22239 [Ancylostoma caninum]